MASETLTELLVAESPCMLNASGVCAKRSTKHLDTQIRNSCIHAPGGQMPLAVRGRDTEAGMLSGISRKRKIRSNLYWFTEFCNSQCLSHFAAPFIVVRAETSVAESCKQLFQWGSPPDDVTVVCRSKSSKEARQQERSRKTVQLHPAALEFPSEGIDVEYTTPPSSPGPSQEKCTVVCVDACE